MINDAAEFALWLSPHIVSNVARVLSEVLGLDGKHIDDYVQVLMELLPLLSHTPRSRACMPEPYKTTIDRQRVSAAG